MVIHTLAWAVILCQTTTQETVVNVQRELAKAETLAGDGFRCATMVSIVNGLRAQGKQTAIRTLRKYVEDAKDAVPSDNTLLICRLLFVDPDGWKPPIMGLPKPLVHNDVIAKFPNFPFAVVDGVPFVLIRGYSSTGHSESVRGCLNRCESLDLIEADLATSGFESAAQKLVRSDDFKSLYKQEWECQNMTREILRQALAVQK